jgi:hypothetical protein
MSLPYERMSSGPVRQGSEIRRDSELLLPQEGVTEATAGPVLCRRALVADQLFLLPVMPSQRKCRAPLDSPERDNVLHNHEKRKPIIAAVAMVVSLVVAAATLVISPILERIPYHTSILSGQGWVSKLLNGHPDRIRTELGMRKHVFLALVASLRVAGLQDLRHVTLHKQVAIFLYMSVTGLKIRHVGERFQHSNETISQCVNCILWPHT